MTARFDALVAPGVVCLVVDATTAEDIAEGLELLSVSGGIPTADLSAASAHVAHLRQVAAEARRQSTRPALRVVGGDPS